MADLVVSASTAQPHEQMMTQLHDHMDDEDKGMEMDEQFAEGESSISSPASNVSGVDAHSSTSSGIATDESSSPVRELAGHSPTSAGSSSGVNVDSPPHHTHHDGHRVQPEKKHICDICSKAFPYLSILESHKRCHTGEKPFKCHYCDKKFAQKATLQVHERTHTGERPYKCRYCEKTFAQYGTKTVHEKSAHLGIRNYKCPKCDKCLSSPSALYTHKKTHGEKVFRCQFCTKTFTLKNYLKLHVRQVHEQTERKHVCKFCHKSFAYAGSLQVHIRTHTGERPYICRFCPKAFASQGNLQSHERTHTGERPYSCEQCGRSFIQKSQLTAHEATHTGGAPAVATAPQLTPFDINQSVAAALGQTSTDQFLQGIVQQQTHRCTGCDKFFTARSGLKTHQETCAAFLNSSAASSSSSSNLRQSQSPINSTSSDDDLSLHRQSGGEENVMLVEGRKLSLENSPAAMAVPNIYAAVSRASQQHQQQQLLQQRQQQPLQPTALPGLQQLQQPFLPATPTQLGFGGFATSPSWLQQQKQDLSPLGGAKAPTMGVAPMPEMASLASMTSAFAPVQNNTVMLKDILDQQQQFLTSLLLQQLQQRVEAAAAPPPPPPVQPSLSLELLQLLVSQQQPAAPLAPSSLPPMNLQQQLQQPMLGRFPQSLGLQLPQMPTL